MNDKASINTALQAKYDDMCSWLETVEGSKFETPLVEGKWSIGQHAAHLIKSTTPLNQALGMPKMVIRTMFGKMNREERDYDTIVSKYRAKLQENYDHITDFLPDPVPASQQTEIIEKLRSELTKLGKGMGKWDEKQLSSHLLPHPLLGKMSVREILLFTLYHTEHHLKAMQER